MKQTKLFKDTESADDMSLTPIIKKGKTKLSAAQSEFNRLNKKIYALKTEITLMPEKERKIKNFYEKYAKPLFEKETALKYDYLIYLGEIYKGGRLNKTDQNTLVDLFLEESEGVGDYLNEEQRAVIMPLIYEFEEVGYGLTHEELEQESVDELLMNMELMGFQPNEAMKKAKTEEELFTAFADYLSNEMGNLQAEEEENQQKRIGAQEKTTSKSKGKKMTKAQLNQKLQEEKTLKSMREIYLELVKELHPDREMDETLRALKEERMKQLTDAYKQKDLASLLMMQINWLQEESSKTPQSQTDEVLKRFNKVLRTQLDRLSEEFLLMCQGPLEGVEGVYVQLRTAPLEELDIHLQSLLSQQKNMLKNVGEYMKGVSTLTGMRAFLKKYRKQQKERSLYDDFFWGED